MNLQLRKLLRSFKIRLTRASANQRGNLKLLRLSLFSISFFIIMSLAVLASSFTLTSFFSYMGGLFAGCALSFFISLWFLELRIYTPLRKTCQSLRKKKRKNDRVTIPFLGDHPQLVELRESLNKLLRQYEESLAQLKQLSADTSHELRTPIAVIKGKIEIMLMSTREPSYYVERLQQIMVQIENMQQIVESILELSRFSKFSGPEWMESVDLLMAADEACENMFPLIEKTRRQHLVKKLSFAPVFGSIELLTRVVTNLLDNASKYTPEGGTIGVETWSDIKKQKAYLRIWDTGQGMDEYAIQKCRDLFWRADTARSGGGYGLGLPLVQRISELHKAEVDIQSTLGKGSSCTLTFSLDTNTLSEYEIS